ncbi:MAG: hypothetical protein FJ291_24940 [Planctomycetes bacterium]|nr:hypothetical protein [Planctomycetota bacterium]
MPAKHAKPREMKIKKKPSGQKKPYWEMTTEELSEATKEFDKEFIAETFKPLTRAQRALWERIRSKGSKSGDTK